MSVLGFVAYAIGASTLGAGLAAILITIGVLSIPMGLGRLRARRAAAPEPQGDGEVGDDTVAMVKAWEPTRLARPGEPWQADDLDEELWRLMKGQS